MLKNIINSKKLPVLYFLWSKMQKGFNTYFLHLFGPKLSITSKNFWNCLWVCLGSETVCPEKDRQTAFYSPLVAFATSQFQRLTWVVYILWEVKSVLHFSQVNLMLQLDWECLPLVAAARNIFPQPRVQVNGKSAGLLENWKLRRKYFPKVAVPRTPFQEVAGRRQQVLVLRLVFWHTFGINLLQANRTNGDGRGNSDGHIWLHASLRWLAGRCGSTLCPICGSGGHNGCSVREVETLVEKPENWVGKVVQMFDGDDGAADACPLLSNCCLASAVKSKSVKPGVDTSKKPLLYWLPGGSLNDLSLLVYWLAWSLISGHEEVKGCGDEGIVMLGAKAEKSSMTVWGLGSESDGGAAWLSLSILGPYWVSIYFSGSLFSVFWLHSREECQFSLHVYNNELSWSVCDE